jgi:maltooligosyltrehalose trehalohydrolase
MGTERETRRYPVGAEVIGEGVVSFRVWAPKRSRVEVVVRSGDSPSRAFELAREASGYFSGEARDVRVGAALYRYRLDGHEALYPDPASRFQPDGPHGESQVVDPRHFRWTDDAWSGVAEHGKVIYELHAGTFTREGTWASAGRELDHLGALGINVIELMPVADFAGKFGWGYDGVDLFAPSRLYGSPDDLRAFIDRAHARGIAVILDVVYNHFGPDGCFLRQFADGYFSERYENEWGDPLNFEGEDARPVREFFLANARYWIEEFHFDGLRLDATQQIFDASEDHIVAALIREVRAAGGRRRTYVVCENESQDARLVRAPERGGWGADAIWNDDFHHAARVAATGRGDRPQRSVLQRLRGQRAGARVLGQMGLSLSGPALQLAEQAPRHSGLRSRAERVRRVSAEP